MAEDHGEPWTYDTINRRLLDRHGEPVCPLEFEVGSRIAACVNACRGLPTEFLAPSKGPYRVLVTANNPEKQPLADLLEKAIDDGMVMIPTENLPVMD